MKTKPQQQGVTFKKQRNRWIVRQTIEGQRKQIGSFKTLDEANALVTNNSQNCISNGNAQFASQNESAPNLSRSQSDLESNGDQVEKVSIGRNEAPIPTREWRSIAELNAWLDQQPMTFWRAVNGDIATLISQQDRIVLVEYKSKKGTIHYEVSRLIGSEYDFNIHNPSTHCFYTKREATKAYNRRIRLQQGSSQSHPSKELNHERSEIGFQ